jgi:hypothetical protein
MMQKKEIETMLALNGIALDGSEIEIRAVFERAGYTESESDTLLAMLRGTAPVIPSKLDNIQKSMRMDKPLKPGEVAQLLGIDMDVDVDETGSRKSRIQKLTAVQIFLIGLVSSMLVLAGLFGAMYYFKNW